MRAQHHRRSVKLLGALCRQPAQVVRRHSRSGVPLRPVGHVPLLDMIERLEQRRQCEGRGRLDAAAEGKRQYRGARQFSEQCDVAGTRRGVFPSHRAVVRKILPPVTRAHVPGARSAPRIALPVGGRRKCQCERSLVRPQQPAAPEIHDLGKVAHTGAPEMGSEQRIGPKIVIAGQRDLDE